MKTMRVMLICLVLSFTVACTTTSSTITTENQVQVASTLWAVNEILPQFIRSMSIGPPGEENKSNLCIFFDSISMWEPGLSGSNLLGSIEQNTTLLINGEKQSGIDYSYLLLNFAPVYNERNEIAGYVPLGMQACSKLVNDKMNSFNIAAIQYTSPAGRVLDYKWAIRKLDDGSLIMLRTS